MVIPDEWLIEPASIEEVEERLALGEAPDLWLEEWRRFVDHFEAEDELWRYYEWSDEDPESAVRDFNWAAEGLARVRAGKAVESISTACPWW